MNLSSSVQRAFSHQLNHTTNILQEPWIAMAMAKIRTLETQQNLDSARHLHALMTKLGIQTQDRLVTMYSKMDKPQDALQVFQKMHAKGIPPADDFIYPSLLKACTDVGSLQKGMQVHTQLKFLGLEQDPVIGSSLVNMYTKLGSMGDACQVFDKMPDKNVVLWSTMVSGYASLGDTGKSMELFEVMKCQGVVPNAVTWNSLIGGFVQFGRNIEALELFIDMYLQGIRCNRVTLLSVISACGNMKILQSGASAHGYAIRRYIDKDPSIGSALMSMYFKCNAFTLAKNVFRDMPKNDIVLWNTMITGYAENGRPGDAEKMFRAMQMIGMVPNVVSWTSLVAGYAHNGSEILALRVLKEMYRHDERPNSVTFASVLPACAGLSAINTGKEIHGVIVKNGFCLDVYASTSLVDMYAKCGFIDVAQKVFERMSTKNVVSWNSMICGYAVHGQASEAFSFFQAMQQSLRPDHVTFLGILYACCQSGLIDEGETYFRMMRHDFSLEPRIEHYSCMVDLLARHGHLRKASALVTKIPSRPDAVVWGSLLSACRYHHNVEIAEFAAQHLFVLEPFKAANYVILSNIYAAGERWFQIQNLRLIAKEKGFTRLEKRFKHMKWRLLHKANQQGSYIPSRSPIMPLLGSNSDKNEDSCLRIGTNRDFSRNGHAVEKPRRKSQRYLPS